MTNLVGPETAAGRPRTWSVRSTNCSGPSVPFLFGSPWPTPDLRPVGYLVGHPPLMLWAPAASPRSTDLDVRGRSRTASRTPSGCSSTATRCRSSSRSAREPLPPAPLDGDPGRVATSDDRSPPPCTLGARGELVEYVAVLPAARAAAPERRSRRRRRRRSPVSRRCCSPATTASRCTSGSATCVSSAGRSGSATRISPPGTSAARTG